jgi:ABC-2 type transport system ATP-binding protein
VTITADHLTKRFRDQLVVEGVTFHAPPGQVTALLGPNGAGKTTTLRMLLGLTRPSAGRALVSGVPYADLDRPLTVVGSLLDGPGGHPGRSARAHLRSLAVASGLGGDHVERALRRVGLADAAHRRVGTYSLGMRQRLGMAAALLAEPPNLVLDEPGNGLDPHGIVWLRGLVRELAADGCAVLLSSHQLAEVAATADHVVVMAGGRVLADRPLSELAGGGDDLETTYLRMVTA